MGSPMLALAQSPPPPKSPAVLVTRKSPNCWSELPLDLMRLVFERLGFLDFERAKSVCSSWLSGSRQSKPNNKIPWMILFPAKNYCLLFNPEDKEKLYKTQHLGDDFVKSSLLAIYRSWLLMQPLYENPGYIFPTLGYNLYILDLLTSKRINLPAFESRTRFYTPILWIDDKTKDYLVIGTVVLGFNQKTLVSFKKGDITHGNKFPSCHRHLSTCLLAWYTKITSFIVSTMMNSIFSIFSGELPPKVFRISVRGYITCERNLHMRNARDISYKGDMNRWINNMAVTIQGDVLLVQGSFDYITWENFRIYKMDSSNVNKWEEIFSLGDESILLDLGITVLAKDLEGITSNSIYFTVNDILDSCGGSESLIFNLETKKVEEPPEFVFSSNPCADVRWFLPSFKRE